MANRPSSIARWVVVEGLFFIAAACGLAWMLLVTVIWLHRPARALVGPALRLIPDLPVGALAAGGSRTPRRVKVALGGLLLYLVSPIDLIPDFVPVVGSLDDVVVTALVLRWAGRQIGVEQIRAHWSGSEEGFALLVRLLGVAA